MPSPRHPDPPPTRPPEALVRQVIEELGSAFDLDTPLGERTLGQAVEQRVRALRPSEPPEWGTAGSLAQVARLEAGPLDFYYRPHLFPEMDPVLRLGHQLQFDLLPRRLPEGAPLRIAAVLESYCHLSGDLLGWRVADGEMLLWIADVSGHGVRAGLAAAVLYFLVDQVEADRPPAEVARRVHESMRAARRPSDPRALYATAFWLRIGADGQGSYASSGHPPMLLRRASGRVEELAATGLPLGLLPDAPHRQEEIHLRPGDRLVLYTDGLAESPDPRGDEFGRRRLAGLLGRRAESPLDTARGVYEALGEHRGTTLLADDLTFLVAEPAAGAAPSG